VNGEPAICGTDYPPDHATLHRGSDRFTLFVQGRQAVDAVLDLSQTVWPCPGGI
jgi:hypothetical protein